MKKNVEKKKSIVGCLIKDQKGFSLIELSVVVSVAAAATVGFLSWTQPKASTDAKNIVETQRKLHDIEKAIDNFRVLKKRLPCPADPLMRPDNTRVTVGTDYNTPTSGSDAYVNDFGVEDLYNTISAGIITPGLNCPVSVGAVPVFSLGLDETYAEDAWGRRFTYEVASSLCGNDGKTPAAAAAALVGCTETDYQTKTGNLVVTAGGNTFKDAAYVVVSHGINGSGAFMPSGIKLTASGNANEIENSDGDGTYVKASLSSTFDDLVVFGTKRKVESLANRKNVKHISVEDCEANSQALRNVTLAENATMKTNLTGYQQNAGGQNTGDQTLLSILKATQNICISYYGAAGATINGKTWSGAQCPGTANVAAGSTYTAATDSCACISGLWDGNCTSAPAFTPTDIAGISLWFDAADISTLWQNTACSTAVTTDGQSIQCWQDKSGTGRHAIATSGDAKYQANGQNGKSVARWPDPQGAWTNRLDFTPFSDAGDVSLFFVIQNDFAPGNNISMFLGSQSTSIKFGYVNNTIFNRLQTSTFGDAWPSANSFVIQYQDRNASNQISYATNGADPAVRLTEAGTFDVGRLGSCVNTDQVWYGRVAEIIIYNSQVSTANRNLVRNYLNTKWAVY